MNNGEQKPLSAIPKPVQRLLHFGIDYLTLNLGVPSGSKLPPKSITFLDDIFSFPHNSTNASDYKGFIWGAGSEEVNLDFSTLGKDQIVYVHRGEDRIMSIRKIGFDSNLPLGMKDKYQYQIQFYGSFFGLVRLGSFVLEDYWQPFLQDIQDGHIQSSISRVDICADIENRDVKSINGSIIHKGKMKATSELEIDDATGIPETVYYGRHSKDWKARIYNKIREITSQKHKETLYTDYLASSCVTRVEIELHSKPCQEYAITLTKCLELKFVLGVYEKFLSNKAAHWGILRFIKSELNKTGHKAIPAERIKISHNQLSNYALTKRVVNQVKELIRRSGLPSEEIINLIRTQLP